MQQDIAGLGGNHLGSSQLVGILPVSVVLQLRELGIRR